MRTLTTTAAALAALACPLPAIPAAAQETTVAEALVALERDDSRDYLYDLEGKVRPPDPYDPARAILRQVDRRGGPSPRPAAELDAFADRVAATMADATLPEHVRWNAKFVLMGAASSDESYYMGGTPYPRAFDLLVEVYEGGTYDDALSTIWLADSVRGPAYVRDVFERSERPPLCPYPPHYYRGERPPYPPECVNGNDTFHYTPWCRAGEVLYQDVVPAVWIWNSVEGQVVPEGLPEHVEDWHRRCK